MIRMVWVAFMCVAVTGCVSTTQIIIKHHFPEEHINYEINQGWTKEYQEKNMKFTYGSKMIDFDGAELTFTKIENTKANGVACVFSDSKGKTIKLTQPEVEKTLEFMTEVL